MEWTHKITQEVKEKARQMLDEAKKEVVKAIQSKYSSGYSGDAALSPYSESHKRRRSRAGKSTNPKTLKWSGTLLKSIDTISRRETDTFIEITLGFTGGAYRRKDQSPMQNKELGEYLSEQQDIPNLLKLSSQDKARIENQYSVQIHD